MDHHKQALELCRSVPEETSRKEWHATDYHHVIIRASAKVGQGEVDGCCLLERGLRMQVHRGPGSLKPGATLASARAIGCAYIIRAPRGGLAKTSTSPSSQHNLARDTAAHPTHLPHLVGLPRLTLHQERTPSPFPLPRFTSLVTCTLPPTRGHHVLEPLASSIV